eukprot:9644620-Heterocapsa_arctica.AAC.1
MISADCSDAYMHFQVRDEEMLHCLTKYPGTNSNLILWTRMAFGHKCAPLLWSRLAAAIGRPLRSLLRPEEGRSQLYLDDPLWILRGSRKLRNFRLSLLLMVVAALGLAINWKKGRR